MRKFYDQYVPRDLLDSAKEIVLEYLEVIIWRLAFHREYTTQPVVTKVKSSLQVCIYTTFLVRVILREIRKRERGC